MYVEAKAVSKEYATVRAVDNVSLSANRGEILALLGPNGAGKSSLVRMLVGLTQPDHGTIVYRTDRDGEAQHLATSAFGYLPEDRGLYLDRTLLDNLNYIARLRGLDKATAKQNIELWLARFDLTERATEPMRQLSKGNQQKVQLIATLLHNPKLVILDEPFSGLDPVNQEFVLRVLEELRSAGNTVILSAHQMALVERMADKLVLMNKGQVIAQGSLAEVRQQLQTEQSLTVAFTSEVSTSQLEALPEVHRAQAASDGHQYLLHCDDGVAPEQLLVALQGCAPVVSFSRQQQSLHELYLQAVQS
ncbi:ABC transporter ATP-binding protein [Pseudidiomarina sediminum]|uniref:ABC transporter ATP-binding protein n=1 Tax=Pseudidiomarina sediminum TaxID=431675 RepID=UPI001C95769D|nr:ATP-binding cassette domain-containing protein [Pseudidiomarina sediminum]MBY6064010.1 ATP-binding cassette domain-containing protein [Pseudidiomarina sediminum]